MELDEHGLKQADSDPVSTLISRMVVGMTVLFVVFAVGDWFNLFPHYPEQPKVQLKWLMRSLHL
jgi:hypothetical protein